MPCSFAALDTSGGRPDHEPADLSHCARRDLAARYFFLATFFGAAFFREAFFREAFFAGAFFAAAGVPRPSRRACTSRLPSTRSETIAAICSLRGTAFL